MYYTIYQTKNLINSKIYIGKHQTKDLDDGYMGSGKHLKNAIKKYGIDNFEKTILFVFETEEEMNLKEKELVTEEFCKRKDTYNICEGGKGGWSYVNRNELNYRHNNRQNSLINMKNGRLKWVSMLKTDPTVRENNRKNLQKMREISKINNPKGTFYGKFHTEEAKMKIGKAASINQSGKRNSQYGTMWVTNGKENKKIKKEDLSKWEMFGFRKGRMI